MLESIHIESYRTLKDTTVFFKDGLNIIIGKNGVGKSNLLGFISSFPMTTLIRRYSNARIRPLNTNYSYALTYGAGERKVELQFQVVRKKAVSHHDEEPNYDILLSRKVNSNVIEEKMDVMDADNATLHEIEENIRSAYPFRGTYINFGIPADIQYVSTSGSLTFDSNIGLSEYRTNELHFLNYFEFELEGLLFQTFGDKRPIEDFTRLRFIIKESFEKSIKTIELNSKLNAFSNIQEIRLGTNMNIYWKETGIIIENLVIEFKLDGVWMPWSFLSDGTKRAFILISQVASAASELVLIEEPEIGLHPFQLYKIMDFLKSQAQAKQIIVSTHSPNVLDILEPFELDHILIASIDKGVTDFRNLSAEQIEKAKEYMLETGDLSNYWLHSDLETDD